MTLWPLIVDLVKESLSPAGIAFVVGMLILPFVMRAIPPMVSMLSVSSLAWLFLHDTSISMVALVNGIGVFIIFTLFLHARSGRPSMWVHNAQKREMSSGKDKIKP
jgi:hypothetical protein